MIHHINLVTQNRPEVLERVLRVVRHRGFTLTAMVMDCKGGVNTLEIQVEAERAIELLTRQLTKLLDVTECQVTTVLAQQARG
ncbi:acetolactate synthase 2 small subunit [Shewanella sp. NIFS-20-20]|uniref:acetolactate synthase 2 small subunit n=1 Tax=Shewanella sp. NIFS-20-20 TaxID=2853806 RepID=UPI001C47B047|nr:acetolactate synthase 2 small subunit [Shewanella sp. NIFS-20-20]MBV7316790.1 acetolactate synthase 2 small subunit [Shewanella sp. NIFS-20-20]